MPVKSLLKKQRAENVSHFRCDAKLSVDCLCNRFSKPPLEMLINYVFAFVILIAVNEEKKNAEKHITTCI